MKKLAVIVLYLLIGVYPLFAQKTCGSHSYQQEILANNPSILQRVSEIEQFTHRNDFISTRTDDNTGLPVEEPVITIPVVVHVLYHFPEENISDEIIKEQVAILNRDFRRQNSDTVNTPERFLPYAADTKIEFKLATSDSKGVSTDGIIHSYTPIKKWTMDDKMKFSSEMGDDAWDGGSYLNIWVCNLDNLLGYATFPGTPADRDGVVISYKVFGPVSYPAQYSMGRTTVHEVGHWLNLRHIWGDADCGDDGVDDTPRQRSYTPGCPSGARVTCDDGPDGDMYMNYMDFTNDPCMNMFTNGQKYRMRSLFEPGGARNSLVYSKGLNAPLIERADIPDHSPKWLNIKVYPNPAASTVTMDFEYDKRWVGHEVRVTDIMGRVMLRQTVSSAIYQLNVSRLKPGIYFIQSEKDGDKMMQKFIKQ